ncbi:1,4-alpha-glucan branching protein [Phototrophicus methaneseepsis]|uniref:1,4-alpha-glucan branching protein n=1 Tax=Phototrophicus methaneseepsis TaxID=2710758 RepID=A0A7S8ID72_9CHLR|nr:alpha-amylase family glycosyl hydrolase [Phototrophicus methaneseepsis]QPC80503.1 1,4-alpha-glucan branching protein [Phototrophicus methaneseepsis]
MAKEITIHFDNYVGFQQPALFFLPGEDGAAESVPATETDEYGAIFKVSLAKDIPLTFKFGDAEADRYEDDSLYRTVSPVHFKNVKAIWCRSWNPFVYTAEPQSIQPQSAVDFVGEQSFVDGLYISDTCGDFALGASPLKEGGVLFGFFHPHAARVYVTGDFNDWQHPGVKKADSKRFLEMQLYKGYFDVPNVWLLKADDANVGQEYKFYVVYDSLAGDSTLDSALLSDAYTRVLGADYEANNSIIVDPSPYEWHDADYQTPAIHELIVYELHVHGFTHDQADIQADHQGKYTGIIDRIEAGYFDKLGITCLYLMPIADSPTPQGPHSLGYNSSLFMAVERDYGSPDELRRLVDTAHQHNLAVIVDQVFNHTANSWNPLWKAILDHPEEVEQGEEGGLYFSGQTPWGNRMSTERAETQNMLIDACKLMLTEYHLDGFRFDATHTYYMDHGFVQRLADELQAFKPEVILIAENLPNESDLNREGYNGFMQWSDYFHDAIKAYMAEGRFEGTDNTPENLGDTFYFSKGRFAAHTNNVLNYCESHDEHSVAHEISYVPNLDTPQAKDRKSRLGLFATMVALGQPMIYMGQEYGLERARGNVYFDFPGSGEGFYDWASLLINLRRRYPALKLHGFNPIEEGHFQWLLGPWLEECFGGGKRVLGWLSTPTEEAFDHMVILMNFENHPVEVDIRFGMPGKWVRLASIDAVNDIPPVGSNSPDEEDAIHLDSDTFAHFVLPDSSGFIYKWEQGL